MPPTNAAEWRDRLNAKLDQRWATMQVFDAYYNGDQDLAFITKKYRDAYGQFFRGLTDNWMPLVVDSSVERLRVQGFRFDDLDADDDAWEIWQTNSMDGQANMVHTESVKLGTSYWMVQPALNGDIPRITAEHPSQMICESEAGYRQNRLAAMKRWADDEFIYCNIYLPDRLVGYRTTNRQLAIEDKDRKWTTIRGEGNPLGVVPVVPVPNNPGMLDEGRSDLAGGPIEIQNAINLLLSSMLIGAEYQAYPLRIMLGVDTPRDSEGNPIRNADLKVAQSRLLMFPGDAREMDVKEFSPSDLDNFRKAIDGLVRDLTAQTRTPPHYVAGQIVNASGDALKAAETGLVSKVRDKMDPFGEAHEETMRLAFQAMDRDDPRAEAMSAETIWRDPESRSQAELVDAAVKLSTIGIPNEALWERIGASPQEIDRWKQMQEAEELLKPEPVVVPVPTNGEVEQPEQAVEQVAGQPAQPPANR